MDNSHTLPRFPRGHNDPVGIWLWGDPAEIRDYLELGVVGLVTNTIVLDQLTDSYGPMIRVIERYLNLPHDGPLVVEVDGDTTDEIERVARIFTAMSPQVVLKIPCTMKGPARGRASEGRGPPEHGHDHLFRQPGRGCRGGRRGICCPLHRAADRRWGRRRQDHWRHRARDRSQRRKLALSGGGIVRTTIAADTAIRAGCDGIVISPTTFEEMLLHPGTAEWNATFRRHWDQMEAKGALEGVVDAPVADRITGGDARPLASPRRPSPARRPASGPCGRAAGGRPRARLYRGSGASSCGRRPSRPIRAAPAPAGPIRRAIGRRSSRPGCAGPGWYRS